MSSESFRNELSRLHATEATLRKEAARHEDDLGRARAAAAQKRKSASTSSSAATASSYLRAAEAEEKRAATAASKLADVSDKLARNSASQTSKRTSLASAEKSEREARERDEKRRLDEDRRRRDKEKSERAAADRAAEQRRRKEKDHARDVARLMQPTVRHVLVREPEPEKLRVLYLSTNPDRDSPLRTDVEVSEVLRALRGAKHRDLVEVYQRPAATAQDLLDGINDVRPHVIHFSGHGGGRGLLFDSAAPFESEGQSIAFDLLAKLLGATDTPPTLLVLNACDTLEGADILLGVAPIVIAMSDSVGDVSAGVFAKQFYAGLAAGQSVGASLTGAKAIMEVALLDDADLPTAVTRADTDIGAVILVRPMPDA